jgi:DNA invertase Pin-like site-specific DNA recombinase
MDLIDREPPGEQASAADDPGAIAVPVVGYATVYAQQDGRSRSDLRSQVETIRSACERCGLQLVELVHEREPRRRHALQRPGLEYALQLLRSREAKGLVVAELSRLTHSVSELGRVLEWFLRSDIRLVAASSGLDTEQEACRLTARTIIEVSRWEHQRLVERTRMGMRAARRKGPRGVADYPELRERIAQMRAGGMTLQAIADLLNAEMVPTVRGGATWRPSSVQTAAGYRRPLGGREPQGSERETPHPRRPPRRINTLESWSADRSSPVPRVTS